MMAQLVLDELSEPLQLTQEDVARVLKDLRSSFSKMENQGDMYISTMRRVVAALGGELQLVAKFPDREVVIKALEEEA
jgi:hypothetical protein